VVCDGVLVDRMRNTRQCSQAGTHARLQGGGHAPLVA